MIHLLSVEKSKRSNLSGVRQKVYFHWFSIFELNKGKIVSNIPN